MPEARGEMPVSGEAPLVCFGEDWGRHPSTLQFLVRELSKERQVIWIDSLGLRTPSLRAADVRRIRQKIRRSAEGVRRPAAGPFVWTPLVIPLHQSRLARVVNRALVRRGVRRALAAARAGRAPIVLTASPASEYLLGHLGECRAIYYCADEYAAMPGVNAATVGTLETRLLDKVDGIVVTSEALALKKAHGAKPIMVLPHGVDVGRFAEAARSQALPELLCSLPRPIIGFHGLLQAIIDGPLVEEAARLRPGWSFVFIGSQFGREVRLPTAPNIHYLPAQPYEDIPRFVAGFDVCMIPYSLDERTKNCNPIKLREYLAAGKPVVSAPLPAVLPYEDVVNVIRNATELVREAAHLLATNSPEQRARRMAAVRGESWAARAAELERFLEGDQQRKACRIGD